MVAQAVDGLHVAEHAHELSHARSPHAPSPWQVSVHIPLPQVSVPHAGMPRPPLEHDTVQSPAPHVMSPHDVPNEHVMLHDAAWSHAIAPHAPGDSHAIVQFQPDGQVTSPPVRPWIMHVICSGSQNRQPGGQPPKPSNPPSVLLPLATQ